MRAKAMNRAAEWKSRGMKPFLEGTGFTLLVLLLFTTACSYRASAAPSDAELNSSEVTESSGLARSHRDDSLLWTHNDSGDSPRLFAFTRQGTLRAIVSLKNVNALDWEDMCSFTADGKHYLAVGDVGDNGRVRSEILIHVLEEPALAPPPNEAEQKKKSKKKLFKDKPRDFQRIEATCVSTIHIQYPKGPLNCEALAFDPITQQFLLATKENFRSQLFAVPLHLDQPNPSVTAEFIGSINIPIVTGASISDDGQQLVLGTYGPACLINSGLPKDRKTSTAKADSTAEDPAREFKRWELDSTSGSKIVEAPQRQQGESICFDKNSQVLLLTSEGTPMPLYIYPLPATP